MSELIFFLIFTQVCNQKKKWKELTIFSLTRNSIPHIFNSIDEIKKLLRTFRCDISIIVIF